MTSPVSTNTIKLLNRFEQGTIIELYDVDISEIVGTCNGILFLETYLAV
ncbi:hypothetical protein [Orbus mooreae]